MQYAAGLVEQPLEVIIYLQMEGILYAFFLLLNAKLIC